MPCALSSVSRRMMSSLVTVSSAPVGSSAKISCGRFTKARAIATRCCWPPESSEGVWAARSAKPTRASAAKARSRRWAALTPEYSMGSSTFSRALVRGSRLNCWNTKPIRRLRIEANWSFAMACTSSPANWYWPVVGRSRQPRIFIRVDLPDPEAPMMATKSPSTMSSDTPRSACTVWSPMV